MSSQLNSHRFFQTNFAEMRAENFFKVGHQGFSIQGLFTHEVPSAESLLRSYQNLATLPQEPKNGVPECFKDQIDNILTIINETSYGTLECPTRTAQQPCSCNLQSVEKKRGAEGFLAKPVVTANGVKIFSIGQAKLDSVEFRAHFGVSSVTKETAVGELVDRTDNYSKWLRPVTKAGTFKLCRRRVSERSKLLSRINADCDLLQIVLETVSYRFFAKAHPLRFVRFHFTEEQSGAYVIAFKLENPMGSVKIASFMLLITF